MKKLFTLLLFVSFTVSAACPQFYPFEKEIVVENTVELCNSFFVIRYDDEGRRNIFSSEILQPAGHTIERENTFHTDPRIKNKVYPHQYSNTGFDKGHMVPAGDAASIEDMLHTFVMTNMTPQQPTLNRESWRMLEDNVRKIAATSDKPIHVLTGAMYEGEIKKMNGVPIPSGYFKAVYVDGQIGMYYASNIEGARVTSADITDIEKRIGYLLH